MDAHEKSKKHVKAVYQLRKQMLKESKALDLETDAKEKDRPEEEFTPMDDEEDQLDDMIVIGKQKTEFDGEELPETIPLERELEETTKPDLEESPSRLPETISLGGELGRTAKPDLDESTSSSDEDDEYVSTEKFSARVLGADDGISSITSGLASANLSDHEDSKPAAKLGKAKAKRAKRAQKAAAVEDQQSQTSDVSSRP